MERSRLGAAALAVVLAAMLLFGAGMPVLAQGMAQASPTPASSTAPSGEPPNVGPSATDPIATVNTLLDVLIGRRFDQIKSFACESSAADLDMHLNLEAVVSSRLPAGVTAQGFFDAMTLAIPDRAITLVSKNDGEAKVHLIATLTVGLDEVVLRPWVKELLVAAGEDSSDPSVDANMKTIVDSWTTAKEMGRDIDLTVDGGHWLICDATIGATPSP